MDPGGRHSIWSSGLWAFLAAIGMLAWIAYGNAAEDGAPGHGPEAGAIRGAESPGEAAALAALLDQAYGVLRSAEFRDNLLALQARYPAVYARASEQDADVARIARIVGLEQWGARYAPVRVSVVDGLDWALAAAGDGGNGRYSGMEVGRAVLGAYASDDLVTRSCAVNVAAHEYAHTISLTPVGFVIAFTDTEEDENRIRNRRHPATPVASYLIGAVAQCTWLQRAGRIGKADVPACAQVFGVQAFNWDRCGLFANGEPVALRPGLPRPTPPL